jgi:hypothetical protein
MRITIEIPDDQVPTNLVNHNYPSGFNEDGIHDLLINYSISHLSVLCVKIASKPYVSRESCELFTESQENAIAFLGLLQQNMKIESGDSKEKILIDGLTEVVKDWYDGCPKSMNFVSRTLKLLKTYMEN